MLAKIFHKDMLLMFRSAHRSVAILLFSLVLVVLASFSFRQIGYGQAELRSLTPGILWMIYLFSGVTAFNYAFVPEQENDSLRGLLLTAVDPAIVFLSKTFSNFLFLVLIQAIVVLAHGIFFGVQLPFFQIVAVVLLVTIGFSALGTILSAMSTAVAGREILLPVILFPLAVPLLIAAISLTREILDTQVIPFASFWFLLVVVFDVVSFALSIVLFEHVMRE